MSLFTSREGFGMLGRAFMESNFIQSFFRTFNFCFALLLSIPLLVTNFCSYILTIILSISAKNKYPVIITSNPSSCSSSPPSSWDVFLSFRGEDTRANFIAHLYNALDQAGIITFMDDHELEKGEEISSALLEAIHSSKMFVVVLSENYAYSPWSLDELVEILFCKRTKNQVVIPLLHYVNPTDVRYQKESFEKAIHHHYLKKRYSDDMIEKWRSALAEIAEISGYHLKKDANEYVPFFIVTIIRSILAEKHPFSSMDTTSNYLTAPTSSSFMDATSNPSSSSSSPPSRWDVLLSFYGKDTRASFIAHLYEALDQAGIQTFRDNPALEKGDGISPALSKAIRSSKKFVVVLSENYAYSPWCLDELIEILFCKRRKNQVVIPGDCEELQAMEEGVAEDVQLKRPDNLGLLSGIFKTCMLYTTF